MTKKPISMKKIPDNQIAFYQSPNGSVNIEVLYAEENIWLTQKKMAELFDCSTDNISLHLRNIYEEKELDQGSTTEDFSVVQKEGDREIQRKVKMYSLEAIIPVGYRVNSDRGTQFRQWATRILKNYIHKGYALNSNRMKYGSRFSTRYFDEISAALEELRGSLDDREKLQEFMGWNIEFHNNPAGVVNSVFKKAGIIGARNANLRMYAFSFRTTDDRSGKLRELLSPFYNEGANLTAIDSMPGVITPDEEQRGINSDNIVDFDIGIDPRTIDPQKAERIKENLRKMGCVVDNRQII